MYLTNHHLHKNFCYCFAFHFINCRLFSSLLCDARFAMCVFFSMWLCCCRVLIFLWFLNHSKVKCVICTNEMEREREDDRMRASVRARLFKCAHIEIVFHFGFTWLAYNRISQRTKFTFLSVERICVTPSTECQHFIFYSTCCLCRRFGFYASFWCALENSQLKTSNSYIIKRQEIATKNKKKTRNVIKKNSSDTFLFRRTERYEYIWGAFPSIYYCYCN